MSKRCMPVSILVSVLGGARWATFKRVRCIAFNEDDAPGYRRRPGPAESRSPPRRGRDLGPAKGGRRSRSPRHGRPAPAGSRPAKVPGRGTEDGLSEFDL
jgi:hypothetical protein